jgi:hypothetical protein
VKDFETEASRMTDEAKRQFQAKAELLNRNAKEMDEQRAYLLKQHNDSMKKLKEEREQAYLQQDSQLKRDAARAYRDHKQSMDELQEMAANEMQKLREDTQWAKDKERVEAQRAVEAAKDYKDRALSSISHELEHHKREGAQALERDRVIKDAAKQTLQGKFDGEIADLRHRNILAVNQANREGQQLISDIKDENNRRASELLKEQRERTRKYMADATAAATTREGNIKQEERLMREGFEHKKKVLTERRDKYIEQLTKETEAEKKPHGQGVPQPGAYSRKGPSVSN